MSIAYDVRATSTEKSARAGGISRKSSVCHRVPSSRVDLTKFRGRTAVVVGAGPGGLMAALTILEEGAHDHVVVFEKRGFFGRRNIVNLYPESLHVFKKLGILDAFLERASRMVDHRNTIFAGGVEIDRSNITVPDIAINPEHSFDAHEVSNGFRSESLFSICLADLQHLLATIACERGIAIVGETEVALIPGADGGYSVRTAETLLERPSLIVLAEGHKGEIYRSLGGKYVPQESLWSEELWVFGNVACSPPRAYTHLLFEFDSSCDHLAITNGIFLPKDNEVNIATSVHDPNLPEPRIEQLITAQAAKILNVAGAARSNEKLVWCSSRPVRIAPMFAVHSHFGTNVIVSGDAIGANSPVAALGASLCTSAYAYAIRQLLRDKESAGSEAALSRYGERVQSYARVWHNKVSEIRKSMNVDIRHRTLQRVVHAMG